MLPLILFADDTALMDKCTNPDLLAFKVNFYLSQILDWCNFNKLAINTEKTKWLFFSNRKISIPKLYLNNSEIERVTVFKYLGFLIDSKLSHKFHVKHLEASLSRYRYISSKIRPVLTIDSAKTFYYGMIHSIVCYCILVWGAVLVEGVSAKRL